MSSPIRPLPKRRGASIAVMALWVKRCTLPLAILAWMGVGALLVWGAGHIIRTLLLLTLAALLAYALAPVVKILRRVMPRVLALLVVYLLMLGGLSILVYLIVRTAVVQIGSLSHFVRTLLTPGTGRQLSQMFQSLGISESQILAARDQVVARLEGLVGSVIPLLTGLVNLILDVVLVAVMSVYLIVDGSRVATWLRQSMPTAQQGSTQFFLATLQRIVGGYIRGQLLLCTLIGVLVGVGMQVIGVPYALLLGVLAFVFEFVPVLGTLFSGALCVLLALTKGWVIALIVLAYFVVVHVIEGDVVGPRIVGKAIGLHPVVSLAALVAGAELFGIWGALFAAPIAGVIQVLLTAVWFHWRETHLEQFQQAKDTVTEKVEAHGAEPLREPEEPSQALTS